MANTTVLNQLQWNGTRGSVHYIVTSDGTALTDFLLIDISTLGGPVPAAIKIRTISAQLNGNFVLTLESDATTDIAIERIEVRTVDETQTFYRDYRDDPGGAYQTTAANKAAAGFTGDLLLTSTSLAASDAFSLFITFEADGRV